MPTVAPRRTAPGVKPDSLVEQSIATAAGKVRLNDLFTGGATAAVLALTYVVVMVILDKWLVLPAWVRQLGFAGFLATLGSVIYFAVVRPWRRRVNPRYIARQVEQTIPDAKNVLINWVDLHDEELPGSVKAAVAAKAADELAGADVDSATQSKRLVWLCISAGILVAVLAGLFILFKWSQFSSLVGRAVNPFSGAAIASRTRIDLLDPTGGHATVTDGEQLNVAISLGGSVPDPNGPDKPRLLVRHNPEATTYDEFPLVRGESSREFALMVPRSVIQNGFWYKVAAGDAVTDEYRVDVRTRPLVTGFHAEYKYPKYLKWNTATGTDARLKAIRGTAVTLTVQTNREVVSGSAIVTAGKQTDAIRGEVTGTNRDALHFKLKLVESGTYTVQFKPLGADSVVTSAEYPIDVEIDQPPTITLTAPKEDEAVLPASALLGVDALLEDDHGVVTAALRFKLVGRDAVVFPAKKYRDGKPFVREKDGTFETAVKDYKDSVKLDALTDARGKPVTLKEGDVLEYWVEATDNCTEPQANVGESAHKKVRIAPPPPKPDPKQQQKDRQRKADEQKAQQDQDKRRQNETRPPEQADDPDPNKQPQQPKDGQPQPGEQTGDPKNDQQQPKNDGQKGGDPNKQEGNKQEGDPNKQEGGNPNDPNQPGNPNQKGGDGAKQSDQEIQKQASNLNEKIEKKNSEPGEGKGDGSSAPKGTETKPNQEKKPADGKNGDGEQNAAQEKGGDTGEKTGEPKSADSKDGGKLTPPERSADKEGPKDDAQPNQPTGDQKSAPKDGADQAGTSKQSQPEQGTQPNDPMNQSGEKSGEAGTAKGAQPQAGEKGGQGGNDPKADQKEIEKAIGELDHENPGTREAARQKLDKSIGKQNRETVERLNRDLKSGDPQKQQQAKKEIDELTKKAKQQEQQSGSQSGQPDKSDAKNPDELSKAKDKGDPERGGTKKEEKQPAGRGGADSKEPRPDDNKGAGEAKGEKPGEPGAKKDAQPKAGGAGNDQKGPPPDAGQEKGAPKAGPNDPMNPMKGGDESSDGKDEGAKQEKPMGSEGGGDEKSTTKPPMTRDDAKGGGKPDAKQGEGNKDQKQPSGPGGSDEKLDPKEMEKAVRELDSENPGTREAARQKLDKAIGKENRETVERLNRDLKSDDKQKQEQAKKDIEELAKKSSQPQQPPKELTEQEKKDIADAAKNLNSKNEAKRKAAEQKIDQMVGKEKREEFQKDLKDLQGDDPQKAQQAREKLEKMAKEAMNQKPQGNTDEQTKNLGGGNYDKKGQPIEDNPENRLKTMELQLDQFKKYKGNKEFLKENDLSEEQYDKFLRGYEEMLNRTRDDLDRERLNTTVKPQLGTPTVRNDAGGQRVVGREGDAVKGTGGVSVAPTGFSEAQKRFAQEAAKRAAEKSK